MLTITKSFMKRIVGRLVRFCVMAVLCAPCCSFADDTFAEQLAPVAVALRSGKLGAALAVTNRHSSY